jgi:hypothetical protein
MTKTQILSCGASATKKIRTPQQKRYYEDLCSEMYYSPDHSGNILFYSIDCYLVGTPAPTRSQLLRVRDQNGNLIENHNYEKYISFETKKLLKSADMDKEIQFKFYGK